MTDTTDTVQLGAAGTAALGEAPVAAPAPQPTEDKRDRVEQMAELFAIDYAQHRMTVLHDDGLYRHIRFHRPSTGMYSVDLVTWPGHLAVGGDIGAYVFARVPDMFEFFRGDREINPHYWSEKVTTGGRRACKEYSAEALRQHVADILDEAEEDWPGVTTAWAEHVADYEYADTSEGGAQEALNNFRFPADAKPTDRVFEFSDSWEWDLTDWTWGFLRACYAIQWGIGLYDAAKATAGAA